MIRRFEHADSTAFKILPESAIVYQAHPFRNDMTVTDPQSFTAWRYNGTSDDRNRFAEIWADEHGFVKYPLRLSRHKPPCERRRILERE